jgi:transcription termination factor Rho
MIVQEEIPFVEERHGNRNSTWSSPLNWNTSYEEKPATAQETPQANNVQASNGENQNPHNNSRATISQREREQKLYLWIRRFGIQVKEYWKWRRDGYGFLRSSDYNHLTSAVWCVCVGFFKSNYLVCSTGDTVKGAGEATPGEEGEKYFALLKVETLNGRDLRPCATA